ncbi:acetyl-CoA carboxylase biotin carboxyl carrier protein [Gloeocapsa sp. PCC 73106]|uniref:acetyl-CoA carboxylase biotin carboxyl carrier protein n=1 Tax=Gloeocapsa sp. PCC 73106 TaxID=102232 RepID=UPI0002ACCC00|nr:acetyl-CoA carboxylase biotin carboxyl carrier protein [Gloeocapsa sp. PCC 73106]ELR97290.1 acetyl-CoA carboxylase, biotin carboxyl carrier protein [Gloeocapsa sp. PCC 73106]
MSIDYQQLRELLSAIAQTNITELNLKSKDFELNVRQGSRQLATNNLTEIISATAPILSSPPTVVDSAPASTVEKEKNWVAITSPMVGTFYRAPAPTETSYVELNDRITVGQTVCIIEAMKLMNEIESEVSGQVMEIVVENGQPVEYGATLMWIKAG